MFAKPINLMMVFIVTAFNLIILALPIISIISPYIEFGSNLSYIKLDAQLYESAKIAIFFLFFIASLFMLVYLFFDFIFGFSVRTSIRGCSEYSKLKDYKFLDDVFKQVQKKFKRKNVKLLIKKSDEINAFALGGIRTSYIVIAEGLINHYLTKSHNMDDFLLAIRSVMGHEMSHIINKDYLPTYLIITNQKITNFLSNSLYFLFTIIARAVAHIPYGGRPSSRVVYSTYTLFHFLLTLFNRVVVYNVYEFVRRFISRSIEYRCDKQSSQAFGGMNMSLALSMLGKRGYFTLFSTHPATQSRINKASKIEENNKQIKPSLINYISNIASFILLISICIYFAMLSQVDVMINAYIQNHEKIHQYLNQVISVIERFL
jgi:Zn-dependent protease with chaperone function